MKYSKIRLSFLIAAFAVFCNVAASEGDDKKVVPSGADKSSTTTTTVAPVTTVPTTTTISTTTVPTTTLAPTTAPTTVPPTTTLAPTKPPTTVAPTENVWTVSDSKGDVCIQMKGNLELKVKYNGDSSKPKQENTTLFKIPSDAKASGACINDNTTSEYLKLTWTEPKSTNNNVVSFTFNKSNDGSEYFIENIKSDVFVTVLGKDNKTVEMLVNLQTKNSINLFATGMKNSFTCSEPPSTDLYGKQLNSTGHLIINSFQYEAYGTKNKTGFLEAIDCLTQNRTPDIVPILVAGFLILLVITVLVAYIISRRRSQNRGYLSM